MAERYTENLHPELFGRRTPETEVTLPGTVVTFREHKGSPVLIFTDPNGRLKRVRLFPQGQAVELKMTKARDGFWSLTSIANHNENRT